MISRNVQENETTTAHDFTMSKKGNHDFGVVESIKMENWENLSRDIAEICLGKLRSGTEIKKNPKEIEDIADAIKSVGQTLTILIKNINDSKDLADIQNIAKGYLQYLDTAVKDEDPQEIKKIAESVNEIGKALEVLIELHRRQGL